MYTGMGLACSKNGWYKDSKEITGKKSKRREETGEDLEEGG